MIIKLIRHGESQQNTGEADATQIGDQNVALTEQGKQEAIAAGKEIGSEFLAGSLVYASPYIRTIQTLGHMFDGANFLALNTHTRIYTDPRLREMEWGILKSKSDIDREEELRDHFGWFYYRLKGGESPADVYDRASTFLESLFRQFERKRKRRAIIVSHGITIRCLVMRWFHLTVDQYHSLRNPGNCAIITITDKNYMKNPQFTSGKWGVTGLGIRKSERKGAKIAECELSTASN